MRAMIPMEQSKDQSASAVVEEQDASIIDMIQAQAEADYLAYAMSQNDIDKAQAQACNMTLDEARNILKKYLVEYGDDMLIGQGVTDAVSDLVDRISLSSEKVDLRVEVEARVVAAVFDGNSVYREIRSTFSNDDDINTPCGSIRAWVIGIFWAVGLASLNQFFAARSPTITISVYLAQLLSYPMGCLAAAVLPTKVFLTGSRFEFTFNPGPFSLKEHMLITIMSNVSANISSSTNIFLIQRLDVFFGQAWAGSFAYQVCILFCIQFFGFSLAGMIRRFLIYPPQMIYYFVLGQAALNKALHDNEEIRVKGWKISRFRFFFVAFGGMFLYYWLPGTIFPTLTFFNWMTWIKPTSAALSIVAGSYYYNLGFNGPLNTFDWNWMTSVIDPIITPFFIVVQIVGAIALWGLFVIIPVFFSNTWYTAYLPINSWFNYDNTGNEYDMSQIIGSDGGFNQTAYENYSPLFLPASAALRYAMMMGIAFALLTFCWLWYGTTFWRTFKIAVKRSASHEGFDDIHSRLMSKYPEVNELYYIAIGVGAAAFGFAGIYGFPTQTPGWILPVSLIISMIFVIPFGAIMAVTAYLPSLEIIYDFIGGYVCRGNPSAFYLFRQMGWGVASQALSFAQDMKLAHYVKIPPKQMFAAQMVSVFFSSFGVLGILQFQLTIKDICNPSVQVHWICGQAQSNYSSALAWGLIGPQRMFTHVGAMYWKIMFAMIAGAVWPIPWYYAKKRWPKSVLRYVHPVVLMLGGIMWAPLNLSMFWQTLIVSWIIGVYIKQRYPGWWAKYAYIISCAFATGIAFSSLIQFFATTNNGIEFPQWWGTTQYTSTCDFRDCRYKQLAEGETFGPTEWH